VPRVRRRAPATIPQTAADLVMLHDRRLTMSNLSFIPPRPASLEGLS
jgi:hypothetical protein